MLRKRTIGKLLLGALALAGWASPSRAQECVGCNATPHSNCPPWLCYYFEGHPRIKFKHGCPKPICDPCNLPHAGYYQPCWRSWPYPPDWSHCPYPPTSTLLPPPGAVARGPEAYPAAGPVLPTTPATLPADPRPAPAPGPDDPVRLHAPRPVSAGVPVPVVR